MNILIYKKQTWALSLKILIGLGLMGLWVVNSLFTQAFASPSKNPVYCWKLMDSIFDGSLQSEKILTGKAKRIARLIEQEIGEIRLYDHIIAKTAFNLQKTQDFEALDGDELSDIAEDRLLSEASWLLFADQNFIKNIAFLLDEAKQPDRAVAYLRLLLKAPAEYRSRLAMNERHSICLIQCLEDQIVDSDSNGDSYALTFSYLDIPNVVLSKPDLAEKKVLTLFKSLFRELQITQFKSSLFTKDLMGLPFMPGAFGNTGRPKNRSRVWLYLEMLTSKLFTSSDLNKAFTSIAQAETILGQTIIKKDQR